MRAITLSVIPLLLALCACASKTTTRVADAATTPLSDLNIVRADIPEVLARAQKQPYRLPDDAACAGLVLEIQQLNDVLGADLDAPPDTNEPSLLERGTDAAENAAVGMVRKTAEGLVPFRGWVRKLSGAERYSRRVSAAITAGSIRRAFLKGVAASRECGWKPTQAAAAAVAPVAFQ